jgi:hypothetical protein
MTIIPSKPHRAVRVRRRRSWLGVAAFALLLPAACELDELLVDASTEAGREAYEELSERWWQWALAIPAEDNPIFDDDGSSCGLQQSGSVWFLAGNTGGVSTRSCTVPRDKALFFPLINVVAFNGPGEDASAEELAAELAELAELSCELELILDGESVDLEVDDHRVPAGPFELALPTDNVFGVPAGTYEPAQSDGSWALLLPLEPGEHSLEFGASLCDASTGEAFVTTSIHYSLTVS